VAKAPVTIRPDSFECGVAGDLYGVGFGEFIDSYGIGDIQTRGNGSWHDVLASDAKSRLAYLNYFQKK
jgi:hypothetical protein